MPVQVPAEPKKNTTIYDNFKGVDLTSDPSNVFRRRSPSGLNMLPDLDGRPHKRTGWEVRFTADDFRTAAGAEPDVEVIPKKIYYFSYNSKDYMMIFNSLGVFYTSEDDTELHLAQLAVGTEDSHTVREFPPVSADPDASNIPADDKRGFFFEGNGIAGFYTFVGLDLYRFGMDDNEEMYFWAVEPTAPRVLIGCDKDGVGTAYEAVNLLTDKRTIEYFGDGTSQDYAIPSTPDASSVTVQIMDVNGVWNDIPENHSYYPWILYNDSFIRFTLNKPLESTVGNLRVTYEPMEGGGSYTREYNKKTKTIVLTDKYSVDYAQTRNVDYTYRYNEKRKKWEFVSKKIGTPSGWTQRSAVGGYFSGIIETPNSYDPNSLVIKANPSGSFVEVTPTKNWLAYNQEVELSFRVGSIARQYGTLKTTYSSWMEISRYESSSSSSITPSGYVYERTMTIVQERIRTDTRSKTFSLYGEYTKYKYTVGEDTQAQRRAFMQCSKVLTFGNNIYNQVFLSACSEKDFRNRTWYSAANDPSYFPDTNYIEVGADDKTVMGLMKIGQYLGVVKKGSGTDASVYLAYATTFDENTTYAVKQSVSGIGAISTGAFNILNDEPLFLSERGIMGVDVSEDNEGKQIRNRSHFINKRLLEENNLSSAISFVFDGLYYLCVNNHCYVLDGAQKTSWANEKTNLQYECYYLDNVPAQCFAKMADRLFFLDNKGNLCAFKKESDPLPYVDGYQENSDWTTLTDPSGGTIEVSNLAGSDVSEFYLADQDGLIFDVSGTPGTEDGKFIVFAGVADVGDTIRYEDDYYTILDIADGDAYVSPGVPIKSEWATIADDDEMVHFFKNLTKKGCVVSVLPGKTSFVDVYLKSDERDLIYYGRVNTLGELLPSDVYVKKKIKKYKRLQIICRNNFYNEAFALDQIIKSYTVGNYSKNRG